MKSDLFWEYVSHFLISVVLLIFCGGFLSNFLLVAGGGAFAVFILKAPLWLDRIELAIPLYGLCTFILVHGITRFCFFKEMIVEWDALEDLHRDALASIKNAPFARVKR